MTAAALLHNAIAAIEAEHGKLSAPVNAGAMKDMEQYKRQTGIMEGLRIAADIVAKQHELLTQPRKAAAKPPQEET